MWIPGNYEWRDGQWMWKSGTYVRRIQGKRFAPGHWDQLGREWVWTPGAWIAGSSQLTPDLTAIIQELVDQPNWTTKSAIVLRFQGSGQRAASSFEDGFRPSLQVEWDPSMHTELPVCATPAIVAQNAGGIIPSRPIA